MRSYGEMKTWLPWLRRTFFFGQIFSWILLVIALRSTMRLTQMVFLVAGFVSCTISFLAIIVWFIYLRLLQKEP